MTNDAQESSQSCASFFSSFGDFSLQNKEILDIRISFLLSALQYDPKLSGYYFGTQNGSFVAAFNQQIPTANKYYPSDRSKPLPADTAYSVRIIDQGATPPTDIWYYKNKDLETIATDVMPKTGFPPNLRDWYLYDPRNRLWYQGVEKEKAFYWTYLYSFYPVFERGITAATPIFNSQKEIIAVAGADITFSSLSEFLLAQKIGKTGRVFILEKTGEILLPTETPSTLSGISHETVASAYQEFSTNQKLNFILKQKGIRYLVHIDTLPVVPRRELLIAIIVPLSDYASNLIDTQKQVMLISIAILIISALIIVYFSKRVSSPIVKLATEVDKIRQLDLESETRITSHIKEIRLMDASIAAMRLALRSFGRYVPKEIVKQLIHKGQEITLGGEKKELTVFCSDITGFTTITESCSTETLISLLTEYFDELSKIILEHEGTIDKYIGDGIMAFWGAPLEVKDHAIKACEAALYCQDKLNELNQKRKKEGKPEFKTRFGINTGVVTVGNVGATDRLNYTVIGDPVNITFRLQDIDRIYHTVIIISENVYVNLKNQFLVRPLDYTSVKGKKEKIKIYELVAKKEGDKRILATPEQIELCTAFTKAYEAFGRHEYQLAKNLFEAIHQKFPSDFPTHFYLERIHNLEKHP